MRKKVTLRFLVFFLTVLVCVFLYFVYLLTRKDIPIQAQTTLPAPTPVVATPTPKPTTLPTLTPTPDPDEQYFSPSEEIIQMPEKGFWSYRSSDLSIQIKRYYDSSKVWTYFVADIRFRNDTAPYGIYASGEGDFKPVRGMLPYQLARKYQAVYAQNDDILTAFDKELKGILIRNGVVYQDGKAADTLAFMPDGSLKIFEGGEVTAQELIDSGVRQALSFGPTLLKDGIISEDYKRARNKPNNPRSAIGMVKPGHFVSIVVDGRQPNYSVGITYPELAQLFKDHGCTLAYNLDGGSSASMVFMGESVNTHLRGAPGQRVQPCLFAFGKSEAVPGVKEKVKNNGNGGGKRTGEFYQPLDSK